MAADDQSPRKRKNSGSEPPALKKFKLVLKNSALPKCDRCGRQESTARDIEDGHGHRICSTCHASDTNDSSQKSTLPQCNMCGHHGKAANQYRSADRTLSICKTCYNSESQKKAREEKERGDPRCDMCNKASKNANQYRSADRTLSICQTCFTSKPQKKAREERAAREGEERGDPHPRCDMCNKASKNAKKCRSADGTLSICQTCYKSESQKKAREERAAREEKERALPRCDMCNKAGKTANRLRSADGTLGLCHTCFYSESQKTAREARGKIFGRNSTSTKGLCASCGWAEVEAEGASCEYCKQRTAVGAPPRLHARALDSVMSLSHTELRELAVQNWAEMYPPNLMIQESCPPQQSEDYSLMNNDQLLARLPRGLNKSQQKRATLVTLLKVNDALNGILPRTPSLLASVYHRMSSAEIETLAKSRGAPSRKTVLRALKRMNRADGSTSVDNSHLDKDDEDINLDPQLIDTRGEEYTIEATAKVEFYIKWLLDKDIEEDRTAWNDVDPATRETMQDLIKADISSLFGIGGRYAMPAADAHYAEVPHGGIRGPGDLLRNLDDQIYRNRFPTDTPTRGLLCGPEALAITLNSLRLQGLQEAREAWEGTAQITADMIMHLLFDDYDRESVVQRNQVGTLSEQAVLWLTDITNEDEDLFDESYDEMLHLNNLSAMQLHAALALLHRNGMIPDDFRLGIVASAHTRHDGIRGNILEPPSAYVYGNYNPGDRVAWIHNDVAVGRGQYNHWEGFSEDGRPDSVFPWGLRVGDADEYIRPRWRAEMDHIVETAEGNAARLAGNAREVRSYSLRTSRTKCIPCRDQKRRCTGSPGSPCQQCCEAVDGETDSSGEAPPCVWPRHLPTKLVWKHGSSLTLNDIAPWDTPDISQAARIEVAKTHQAEPEPDEDYILSIFVGRASSGDLQDINRILAALAQNHHHYDILLRSPPHAHLPVVQHAGGPLTPLRAFYLPLVRHGGKMVPSHLGNLQDPFLISFVNLIHAICSPATQRKPLEIHFITSGLCGFSQGIERWQGFYDFVDQQDQINGTNIAASIFIIPVIEPHVVDGVSVHAIDYPHHSPNLHAYRNKYLVKVNLRELLQRYNLVRGINLVNAVLGTNLAPPNTPGAALLDWFINAGRHEGGWRGNLYDQTTNPRASDVAARQHERNRPMH